MRKIFIKIAVFLRYLMRGFHSADVEAFEGKTQESEDGTTAEQQQETNNVYQNLLKGEVTQAVKELRYEMYQAERNSYDYKYSGGGSCEKIGTVDAKNVDISDGEKVFLIQANRENPSTLDDFEIVRDGGLNYTNDEKRDYGERLIHSYKLNIKRDFLPRYKIEEFCYQLVVKQKGTDYILDFYMPFYKDPYNKRLNMFIKEIEKIKNGDIKNDIIDCMRVSFVTDNAYGAINLKEFSFGDLKFKEISEYGGCYIIRFIGKIMKNGIDLTDEFYDEIADRKNRNHEMREGATLNLNDYINKEDDFDTDKALELIEKIKE